MAAQAESVVAKKKPRSTNATQPTFADIAHRKVAERIETYRGLVKRQAEGESLGEADLTTVAECLEGLGLPDYSWSLHVEAVQRHATISAKAKAATDAGPANRQRSLELGQEIEALQAKLRTLLEERRKAESAANKGATYDHSLSQLAVDHAVVLADLDTAARLRLEELNKRRAAS